LLPVLLSWAAAGSMKAAQALATASEMSLGLNLG
jgi:hypothetical protein